MDARTDYKAELLPASDESVAPQISNDPDLQQHFEEFLERTAANQEGAVLRVYRVPTDPQGNAMATGTIQWLFAAPIDRYTLDEVLEKVRNEYIFPSENSIIIRMMVTQKGVRGSLFNRMAEVRKGRPNPDAPSSPESPQHVLTVVGKMLADQQARTESLFREAFNRQQPQGDLITQLAALVTAVAPVLPLFMRAGGGGGVKEALETIQLAKTLLPQTGENSDSAMPAITAGIQALPSLIEALNRAKAAQQPPTVTVRPAPPPAAIAPPMPPQAHPEPAFQPPQPAHVPPPESADAPVEVAPPPGGAVFSEISKQLTDLSAMLSMNGTQGFDPDFVANAYAQRLPETLPPEIDALLFAPNGRAQLDAIAPKIREHKEWFDKFYAALQKIYSEEGPAPA